MKTRFEVSQWSKHGELDSYENGCDPDTGFGYYGTDRFGGDTLEALVESLRQFVPFKTDSDAVVLNACDDLGRIDIHGTETEAGDEPTAAQLEKWRAGQFPLYYVTYTFHVERVTRETIELPAVAGTSQE